VALKIINIFALSVVLAVAELLAMNIENQPARENIIIYKLYIHSISTA